MAGDAYMTYHKYDEAAEIAQVPVKGLSDKNLLSNLARMMWGSAVATKGDCKQAIEIWKPLLDNKTMAFVQSDASLRSGLCYESLNQTADAMKMYEKVAADSSGGQGGESPTAATAKGLMRALQLKTKTPVAAPAALPKGLIEDVSSACYANSSDGQTSSGDFIERGPHRLRDVFELGDV